MTTRTLGLYVQHPAFDEWGRLVVRFYGRGRPVASFLPGIAGSVGTPRWTFYPEEDDKVRYGEGLSVGCH
jgi:hypothetical protein